MAHNLLKHIYYINLDHRTDRKEQIEAELIRMGLKGTRFPGTIYCATEPDRFNNKNIYNPNAIGCHISHLNLIKLARDKKLSNILILEDDFQFIVNKEELEFQITAFNNLNIEYNVVFLGYNVKESEPFNDLISYGRSVQTASGYVVNQNFYDILIENLETNLEQHIRTQQSWAYCSDQCWKSLQKEHNFFYFNTRIGQQRMSYSDIENAVVCYGV
jgi:glycosyl transferase family 25